MKVANPIYSNIYNIYIYSINTIYSNNQKVFLKFLIKKKRDSGLHFSCNTGQTMTMTTRIDAPLGMDLGEINEVCYTGEISGQKLSSQAGS